MRHPARFFAAICLAGAALLGGPGVMSAGASVDRFEGRPSPGSAPDATSAGLSGSWQATTNMDLNGAPVEVFVELQLDSVVCELDVTLCGRLQLEDSDGQAFPGCDFPLQFVGKDGNQYTYESDPLPCKFSGWGGVALIMQPRPQGDLLLSREDGFTLLLHVPPGGHPATDTEPVRTSGRPAGGPPYVLVLGGIALVALIALTIGFPTRSRRTTKR
jgi:hypothetical protein